MVGDGRFELPAPGSGDLNCPFFAILLTICKFKIITIYYELASFFESGGVRWNQVKEKPDRHNLGTVK